MGRFTVTTAVKGDVDEADILPRIDVLPVELDHDVDPTRVVVPRKRSILRRSSGRKEEPPRDTLNTDKTEAKYPVMVHRLENMERLGLTGSTTILPGFQLKPRTSNGDSLDGASSKSLVEMFKKRENGLNYGKSYPPMKKAVSFENNKDGNMVDWVLDDGDITNDLVSNGKNVDPSDMPENLLEVVQGLGDSPGTTFVSLRSPKNEIKSQVPSVSQVFERPRSSSTDAQIHRDPVPAAMPASLSSLFGVTSPPGEKISVEENTNTPSCTRCSCEDLSSEPSLPSTSVSLPNSPAHNRRRSKPSRQEPAKIPMLALHSSAAKPPDGAGTSGKSRFTVAPDIQSAVEPASSTQHSSPCSSPITIPKSRVCLNPQLI